jgi:hypothetical protein
MLSDVPLDRVVRGRYATTWQSSIGSLLGTYLAKVTALNGGMSATSGDLATPIFSLVA